MFLIFFVSVSTRMVKYFGIFTFYFYIYLFFFFSQIFPLTVKIGNINDQYWTLRAEEIPEEEKTLGPQDRLIHVYHFTNRTGWYTHHINQFSILTINLI
ncbi:putative ubiquitinyl hydrolase 1 [Helianthus debilis subsp. tardiflorus]